MFSRIVRKRPGVLQHAGARAPSGARHELGVEAAERDDPGIRVTVRLSSRRRLRGSRRADDGDRAAGAGAQGEAVDERPVRACSGTTPRRRRGRRQRREPSGPDRHRRLLEARRAARGHRLPARDAGAAGSPSSRAERLGELREYWMNACTSPIDMPATPPADDGDRDVDQVSDEHHRGHDGDARQEQAPARLGRRRSRRRSRSRPAGARTFDRVPENVSSTRALHDGGACATNASASASRRAS